MGRMQESTHKLSAHSVHKLNALGEMISCFKQARTLGYRHLLNKTNEEKQKTEKVWPEFQTRLDNAIKEFSEASATEKDKQWLATFQEHLNQYLELNKQFYSISYTNDIDAGLKLFNKPMRDTYYKVDKDILEGQKMTQAEAEANSKEVDSDFATAKSVLFGATFLALIVCSFSGWMVTRVIRSGINSTTAKLAEIEKEHLPAIAHVIEGLESGDLTRDLNFNPTYAQVNSNDEIGELQNSLNSVIKQLDSLVTSFHTSQSALTMVVAQLQNSASQISSSAQTVAAEADKVGHGAAMVSRTMSEVSMASEESARGIGYVAAGTASQSRAISEGAEHMSKLASTVREVASDAENSAKASSLSLEVSAKGSDAVGKSIAAMERIQNKVEDSSQAIKSLGASSDQIGSIVATIHDIAEQTNLLALNAAIEAARAGEQGRGFAVVADEVRKLAERSTSATQEIGSLISKVQELTEVAVKAMEAGAVEVKSGAELTTGAGAVLEEIRSISREVATRSEAIAKASGAMTSAAEEANSSIREVSEVIEQTSAAAQEMSASAEEVSAAIASVLATTQDQTTAASELASSSDGLTKIAQELEVITTKFKVNSDAGKTQSHLRVA